MDQTPTGPPTRTKSLGQCAPRPAMGGGVELACRIRPTWEGEHQ
jgi:hypothetical protein